MNDWWERKICAAKFHASPLLDVREMHSYVTNLALGFALVTYGGQCPKCGSFVTWSEEVSV